MTSKLTQIATDQILAERVQDRVLDINLADRDALYQLSAEVVVLARIQSRTLTYLASLEQTEENPMTEEETP